MVVALRVELRLLNCKSKNITYLKHIHPKKMFVALGMILNHMLGQSGIVVEKKVP